VKKIAAMAANLNPTSEAFSPEVLALIKTMMDSVPPDARKTQHFFPRPAVISPMKIVKNS
jgi:hypothetical protein